MVAFGTIETVLLPVGIEMSTRRFEIRPFALGYLMEVDGMFSGCKIVKVELEPHSRALIPDQNVADGFTLSIFEFDLGLGCASGWQKHQRDEQTDCEKSEPSHR